VIDDVKGVTVVSASTVDPEVVASLEGKVKKAQAELVGQTLAKRAMEKASSKWFLTAAVLNIAAGSRL